MNSKAASVTELIVLLIIIVVTSATILLLVKFNVLTLKADGGQEPVLNAEFIPYAREGTLVVKEFSFCRSVDDAYNCLGGGAVFIFDELVYYRFGVESSTFNGDIKIVKNYRIRGPAGDILLDVGNDQQYEFNTLSKNDKETVLFKDYFVIPSGLPAGEYTLELVVENPLLTKTTTMVQKFVIEGGVEG